MKKISPSPPPNEKMVQDALLRLLREDGLEPREHWLSVRLVNDPWPLAGMYTVIIGYPAAKVALSRVLRRITRSDENEAVGVWVLNESEARQLCAGPVQRLSVP
jgi:hypothetical protein